MKNYQIALLVFCGLVLFIVGVNETQKGNYADTSKAKIIVESSENDEEKPRKSSSYYYSDNWVPVNCEKALTDEEAEALVGTGFHNTRPNSSAESIEIQAAKVKCIECGMHSSNGLNSLCDYCRAKKAD